MKSTRSSTSLISTIVALVLIVATGLCAYFYQKQISDLNQEIDDLNRQIVDMNKRNTSEYVSTKGVVIYVYSPSKEAVIKSGDLIIGSVPGNWSFEASFPVKLLNSQGDTVAEGVAKLLDDWMTDDYVPFTAKLEWSSEQSGDGELVLQKDNPSGLDTNEDQLSIPIKF